MTTLLERLKIFSIFWILAIIYFLIPLFIDPITAPYWIYSLDNSIPFVWWMIVPYYFHYIFIIIPPFIIKDNLKLHYLTSTLIKVTMICYLFYIFWPISSGIVLDSVSKNNPLTFFHSSITFDFLYQNAFPSMHVVISSVVGAVLADEYPKVKWIIYCIVLGIFCATFFIKQHYMLDSIAGLIIAIPGYLFYRRSLII